MMGSSGEMATAEQMKGERVVCSNTALSRGGQMEKLSANQVAGLSPPHRAGWTRGCVRVLTCLCFLPRLVEKLRLAGVSGAGPSLHNSEPRAWRPLVSIIQGWCFGGCQQIHWGPFMCENVAVDLLWIRDGSRISLPPAGAASLSVNLNFGRQ